MKLVLLTLSLLALPLHAKVWRNTDGSKTFQGEFQAFQDDKVRIKMLNNRIVTLPLDRLHPEDREWVKTFAEVKTLELAEQKATALFANLNFGDGRDEALEKLQNSSVVTSLANTEFAGRSGLNGLFQTKAKIGPYHCLLYFDWSSTDKLREITLRSEPVGSAAYQTDMMSCWEQMVHLMSELLGKPLQAAPYPQLDSLNDGFAANTHKWKLKGGGSALVGVGLQNGGYMVTARFAAPGSQ